MSTIKYTPRWAGSIEGRAVNLIKKFYPQLAAEYEFEDLVQEAYIVFMRCKQRYGKTIDNPAWFMSLFQRALQNKMINMLARCRAPRYISIEDLAENDFPATHPEENFMRAVLRELPPRVRHQLSIFLGGVGTETEQRKMYHRLMHIFAAQN